MFKVTRSKTNTYKS